VTPGSAGGPGATRPAGEGRGGAIAHTARLIRTVRYLRPRQILFRLLRRGPAARISERLTGPPWRRCGSGDAVGSTANPFGSAPDPPARLTGTELVVDGVSTVPDPIAWSGRGSTTLPAGNARGNGAGESPGDGGGSSDGAEGAVSRFRLYRLHSHLFLAHSETDLVAAHAFLDLAIPFLFADHPRNGDNTIVDTARRIAWEPHPVSLRLISWVRFAHRVTAKAGDLPERFNAAVACQARYLARHIEYETDGNHLIDNAVALILSGHWLGGTRGARVYLRGLRLLFTELPRQLLSDGFHNERSPMYHRLMTERVLDVCAVLPRDTLDDGYLGSLATQMVQRALDLDVSVTSPMTLPGADPALNDSFRGMAPSPTALADYATALGVGAGNDVADPPDPGIGAPPVETPRLFDLARGPFRVLFDADAIGPDHVPGHAHADTLQVLLWYAGRNTIVDTGVSTYDAGPLRDYERSTAAHNTVVVDGENSSEVWGAFRVGRRARIVEVSRHDGTAADGAKADGDSEVTVVAVHDGYRRYGVLHRREVTLGPDRVVVTDRLVPVRRGAVPAAHAGNGTAASMRTAGAAVPSARAYWHLAPEVASSVRRISASRVALNGLEVEFRGATKFDIERCEIAAGYEKRVESVKIVVEFEQILETVFEAED